MQGCHLDYFFGELRARHPKLSAASFTAAALVLAFFVVYTRVTPYDEVALIRAGQPAPPRCRWAGA
jgi:uncharacterized membrane protein YjfL (UPF0719 family)